MSHSPSDQYCKFGFAFKPLKKAALELLCTGNGIEFFGDTKPMLRAKIEKYYGLQLIQKGRFPEDICDLDFDPRTYSEPELCMLLSTFNIHYDWSAEYEVLADLVLRRAPIIRYRLAETIGRASNPNSQDSAVTDLIDSVRCMSAVDGPTSDGVGVDRASSPHLPVSARTRNSNTLAPAQQASSLTSTPFNQPQEAQFGRMSFRQPSGASSRGDSQFVEVADRVYSNFASPSNSGRSSRIDQTSKGAQDSIPGSQRCAHIGLEASAQAYSEPLDPRTPEIMLIENGYITVIAKLQDGDHDGAVISAFDKARELALAVAALKLR